ncbi:MAG: hypothetical protein JO316_07520 [Abitibacteriaceae bacterium]|nr:hypothetical protein [Abditibacteriaceae bacterium]MBV9865185.1 hypothetical protein [Abditibacteriaceae bacterium]
MNTLYFDSILTIAFWLVTPLVFLIVAVAMGYRIKHQEARESELSRHSVTVEVD